MLAYYIAYGPYGARAPSDPAFALKVVGWLAGFALAGFGLWTAWQSQLPKLRTTTKEWKEATAQLEIENRMNPYTGPFAKQK